MVKIFALLLLCAVLGATSAQISVAGDYPSHVAVHIVGGRIGEGVILNVNHVLTLASNVFHEAERNVRLAPADISVSAGVVIISAPATGTLPVMRIFAHNHYNFHTGKFNVAVLRMTNNFNFNPNEPRPNQAPVAFNNRIVPVGTNCQIVGFLPVPATQNRQLQASNIAVLDRGICNGVNNGDIRGLVFDEHICVGTTAQIGANCNFNDGAAFYCDGELVGLRTLGLVCNAIDSPGVLVQSRWFQDWIPQQFTRTDNPLPGLVPPPGVGVDGGASTVILSTIVMVFAILIGSLEL